MDRPTRKLYLPCVTSDRLLVYQMPYWTCTQRPKNARPTRTQTQKKILSWTWKSSRMTGTGALSEYRTLHAVHMLIRYDQRTAREHHKLGVPNQGCMDSAQGPLDVPPGFHVHGSTRQVVPYQPIVEYHSALFCFDLQL